MMVVVSYDIVNDGTRTRLHKLLLDYGTRVQKSVFECHLDDRRLVELQTRVQALIDLSEDSVRYYELCKRCAYAIEVQGLGTVTEDDRDQPIVI